MKWQMIIITMHILCSLFKNVVSQYDPYSYDSYATLLQGYQQNVFEGQSFDERWPLQQRQSAKAEVNYCNEYATCSCETCNNPQPCCKEFCKSCPQAYSYNEQIKYIYLPYPYPVSNPKENDQIDAKENVFEDVAEVDTTIITTKKTTLTTTTESATTSIKTTINSVPTTIIDATTSLPNLDDSYKHNLRADAIDNDPFHVKQRGQFMLTSLRRTKPNWIPNYGIVPISDKFAEKLMLQLRSMKVLHPRKNNLRTVDDMASAK